MSERFRVVDVNPNETTGGGGCLCSEVETPDTQGPFVVFYGQDMENPQSPYPVLCAGCACAAAKAVEGETLQGGEDGPRISIELDGADVEEVAEESEEVPVV